MILFLTLVSGIAWTVVYMESIRVGFRDRSYPMPVAALALNIAWESIHAEHALATETSAQGFVNAIWALADVVIVYMFIRFGRRELPEFVTRPLFAAWTAVIFATAYLVQWMFIAEFGWVMGARYSAFLQNLLMSGLFISMFVARRGARGQSLVIAAAKWLGTLAPTILFGIIYASPFILGLGILCSVFDIVYTGLLVWDRRRPSSSRTPQEITPRPVQAGTRDGDRRELVWQRRDVGTEPGGRLIVALRSALTAQESQDRDSRGTTSIVMRQPLGQDLPQMPLIERHELVQTFVLPGTTSGVNPSSIAHAIANGLRVKLSGLWRSTTQHGQTLSLEAVTSVPLALPRAAAGCGDGGEHLRLA